MSDNQERGGVINRRTLVVGTLQVAGAVAAGSGILGVGAMVLDWAETHPMQQRRERYFAELAAEREAVRAEVERVTQRVQAVRDATLDRVDSRGGVWFNTTYAQGNAEGRVYLWPFSNGSGFRIEDRPDGQNMTIINVVQTADGFVLDTAGCSPDATDGYLIRRTEFYNNGLRRVVDGVPQPNGSIQEVEVDSAPAAEYTVGVMDTVDSILDRCR